MSLRAKLLVAVAVVALLSLTAADLAVYSALRSSLYRNLDASLTSASFPIQRAVSAGGGPGGGSPGAPNTGSPGGGSPPGDDAASYFCFATVTDQLPGSFVEVRDAKGSVVNGEVCRAHQVGGHSYSPDLPRTLTGLTASSGPGIRSADYFDSPSTQSGGPSFRVRVSEMANGDELVLAVSLATTDNTLGQLILIELAVTAGALVFAFLLGWWLVAAGLRPLRALQSTALAISDGELDRRAPGDHQRTEVGRLALAFNVMLGRISDAFAQREATEVELRTSRERLRRFVSDASHELRTPIAAVSAYAELFESGASERQEDLPRLMGGIRTETARMGRLVGDLLLLARLDESRPLENEPVELVGLAAEAIEAASAVGPQWPLSLQASDPVEVLGDRVALRQVLDNLLSNIRAHTLEGTRATVSVTKSSDQAVVTVADEGPGISGDQADLVFERFFRADPSRSRATGGSGLGLAIVASIAQAHSGAVDAAPRPGGGTVFTFRLPLADSENDEAAGPEYPGPAA